MRAPPETGSVVEEALSASPGRAEPRSRAGIGRRKRPSSYSPEVASKGDAGVFPRFPGGVIPRSDTASVPADEAG